MNSEKTRQSNSKFTILLLLILILAGCAPVPAAPTSTAVTSTPLPPTATAAPTEIPTPTTNEPINLSRYSENKNPIPTRNALLPNLWTEIPTEKITLFPRHSYTYPGIDHAIDTNGGTWIVGYFGIIYQDANGEQTWYHLKNGLPRQFYSRVAVSPSGEVWVGGMDNTLLRFDGKKWIDEGARLPAPYDNRYSWLCYSQTITGIDFGPDGETWVMNNGLELYYQYDGQWINFPFPKSMLPVAGAGNCPLGLRVKSKSDIQIKLSPG